MSAVRLASSPIAGEAIFAGQRFALDVLGAAPHSLVVAFTGGYAPGASQQFERVQLAIQGDGLSLGRCQFRPHRAYLLRRHDDPQPEPGDGRLIFLESVYDFNALFKKGAVVELEHKVQQLPLVWGRKDDIVPAFREHTADLVYDLQVYRSVFDEIDRNMADEPADVVAEVQQVTIGTRYADFRGFFDERLVQLEQCVQSFNRQDHERHGFYFRKHVWDVILASPFLARTNLKPRGYAGDSIMMQMVYDAAFEGRTIFAKLMHYHPIQTAAAQAVRNRRVLIANLLRSMCAERSASGEPLRVMSVACGPACELNDVLLSPEDARNLQFSLLDQDEHALQEARSNIATIEQRLGADVSARLIRDSVRTMLRTPRLSDRWGTFHVLYSMGLFDYLTEPVARAVLGKLYEMLVPGGEMVIGNFHATNPTRLYMEYWMDWVLFYRTEEEFVRLADGLPAAACSVSFEGTGSQMFLRVRKNTA